MRRVEVGAQDTDHDEGLVIEHNRLADEGRVAAQGPLPDPVADDDNPCTGRVARLERAPEVRLDPQHVEVVFRNHVRQRHERLVELRECHAVVRQGGHAGERRGARRPCQELGRGCSGKGRQSTPAAVAPQQHEAVGLRVR